MAQQWPRTARRDRPKRKSDVRKSSDTLEPVPGLAGDSTAKRIAAWRAESSDDEPPRTTASAPAKRSVRKALFGATAATPKRARPATQLSQKDKTAALLLERVFQGNLRPGRPPAVEVKAGDWRCPMCFAVLPDQSAGIMCHPVPSQGGEDPRKRKASAYAQHLTKTHGFAKSGLPGASSRAPRVEKVGVGSGNHKPQTLKGNREPQRDPTFFRWQFRWGKGFDIEEVRKLPTPRDIRQRGTKKRVPRRK